MYKSIESLPLEIREAMPQEALELYRAAFNRVCETQSVGEAGAKDRFSDEAHKAAILAVQEKFSQDESGKWQPEPMSDRLERQAQKPEPPETN